MFLLLFHNDDHDDDDHDEKDESEDDTDNGQDYLEDVVADHVQRHIRECRVRVTVGLLDGHVGGGIGDQVDMGLDESDIRSRVGIGAELGIAGDIGCGRYVDLNGVILAVDLVVRASGFEAVFVDPYFVVQGLVSVRSE